MTRSRIRVALALGLGALLLGGAWPLLAQANSTTATIAGTTTDDSGGALPGVSIEGVNAETGFRRGAVTDVGGRYTLTLLPPGRYTVTAKLTGFASVTRSGLTLALGSETRIDFTMRIVKVAESVTVTAAAPVVESTKTEVSSTVNDVAIKNLPLQTRNFTDLVVLTPGANVDDTNRVHLSGQRGINNSFNVDGADSNSQFFGEQRGGTRPPFTFSQGAIQEFQVITSSYNAQYGNATGGIVNAITKSGTNDFHGEAFGFFRNKAITQKDAAGFIGDDFQQVQFGGFFGGPIVKDKLFFFGGYDGQRLKDPFQAAYDNRGTPLDPLTNPVNLAALKQYGIDPDTEWSTVTQTNDVDSPFIKMTWNASDAVTVSVRDNYNTENGDNLTNGRSFPNDGISNNGLEKNFFNSLVANVNWAASQSLFNEFIGQAATEHRPRQPNSTELPESIVSQFGRWGQNNFLPNNLDETRLQFTDNVSWFAGPHTVKAGVDYSHIKFSDEFYRYRYGVYNFSSYANFVAKKPSSYRQDFSDYNGLVDYSTDLVAFYVQDEWRPNNRLTINAGIRWDYQRQPDSADVNPLYPSVESIPSDGNNWAPRLGVAWDPQGDGKSVLRAGVGVFFVTTPSLLTANALLNNGVRVLDYNISCPSSVCPAGVPTYPNILANPGALTAAKPGIFVFDSEFQNTQTTRVSVGYEREVVKDWSAGVDLIYAKTIRAERVADLNLRVVGTLPDGRPKYSTSPRPNPNFGAIQQFTSDADGTYKGLLFSVRKRFSNGWQVNASYAYGDSRDNQSNERSVSLSSNTPEDSFNLNNDFGPSDFDVRHTIVISGTFELPWGFRLSPLYRWRSGVPYTAGNSVDVNGDNIFNDRANDLVNCVQGATGPQCDLGPNHVGRNAENQGRFQSLDLTLSKEFANLFDSGVGITLYVQGFNVQHSSNWRITSGNLNQVISAGTVGGVQKYRYNANYAVVNTAGPPRAFQLGARVAF